MCVYEGERKCVCVCVNVKSVRYANKTTFYIQIVKFVNVEQAESRCLKFIKKFHEFKVDDVQILSEWDREREINM